MSTRHPNILYAGHPGWAARLQLATQGDNWYIYTPTSMLEALSFYVFYAPDLVIIDTTGHDQLTCHDLRMAYEHLLSVNAEPVLLVTDNYLAWNPPAGQQIAWLPASSSVEDIIDMACTLIEEKTGEYPAVSLLLDS